MVVLIVVEVVLYYHFSIFTDKKWAVFSQKGGQSPDFLEPIAANHGHLLCSDDAGKSFRDCRNGVPTALERS